MATTKTKQKLKAAKAAKAAKSAKKGRAGRSGKKVVPPLPAAPEVSSATPQVINMPATKAIRRIMADKSMALPRLRRLTLLATKVVAESPVEAAVNLGAVRVEEEGTGLRVRSFPSLKDRLNARKRAKVRTEDRRVLQQQEVERLLAEVDERIQQAQAKVAPTQTGITPKTKVPVAPRLDRAKLYSDCNLELRLAVFNIINAVSQVETAQVLHGSRQPAHLEKAEAQLQEAQSRMYAALRAMKPMREFVPSYARSTP